MNDTVRIRLSWGLIALAVIHAIAFGVFSYAVHPRKSYTPPEQNWSPPSRPARPYSDTIQSRVDPLQSVPPVNLDAQNELKQAGGCPTCVTPTSTAPLYINGERVVAIGPSRIITPTTVSGPALNTVNYPETIAAPGVKQDRPAKKAYQLALFLDDSQQSKLLATWFGSDPQLLKLREASEFQIYTPANAIYKARFSEIVPVDQFPVVLFQDSTGGHIHAAGRSMIPGTPAELWDDIRKGQKLWTEAKSGNMQMTGAIKTKGYSWDSQILPSMQLQSQDCDDGTCPTPNASWRPGDRFRPDGGGLFDQVVDNRNAFVWANVSELLTFGLIGLAAIMLFAIIIRRGA